MNFFYNSIFLSLLLLTFSCSSLEQKAYAPMESPGSRNIATTAGDSSGGIPKETDQQSNTAKQTSPKRYIIYNVNVTMQAKDIETKVTEVIKLAESFEGYALQYSSGGNVSLKVPSEKMKSFLESLKKAAEQYYEEISAKDVTEEFLDTEMRLENARKMRTRLLELLKSAKTLEETMKVEAEISKVSENIERIEGRLKFLSTNIAFSTITIRILRKYEPNKPKEYKPGPLGYPFYYAYIGLGKLKDGLVWLFVQEE